MKYYKSEKIKVLIFGILNDWLVLSHTRPPHGAVKALWGRKQRKRL